MKPTPQSPIVTVAALAAAAAMLASFFAPLWWVSLTAPNYPVDRFPDGIRIVFGFDGVTNGCTTAPKASRVAQETTQEDLGWRSEESEAAKKPKSADTLGALDCVHEMNTINHYVGMRPIGVGAPVEILLGRYIVGMFVVMLVGFALGASKARLPVLAVGFAGISGWMFFDLFGRGALADFVARYKDDASKYFNEAERIAGWGQTLTQVSTGVALGLVALMAFAVFASWKWRYFQLVLGFVPALLPGYFLGAYAAWLWFFGHNMHPWGAFTLKPFMPTVFGDGKVAQFSTHSYPAWGFAVLASVFFIMGGALSRRRLELVAAADGKRATTAVPVAPVGPPKEQGAS